MLCRHNQTDLVTSGKILVKSYEADTILQSEHRIKKIVLHAKFNGSTFENDIAVIYLQSKLVASDFVKFAKLPFDDYESQTLHYLGRRGLTDGQTVYQHFPMELESSVFCKKLFKALGTRVSVGEFQVCKI
jgi:hypothetical protein